MKYIKNRFLCCVVPSLMLIVVSAQAGIYKWVDEDGRVYYGDKPPAVAAGVPQQPLDIDSQSGSKDRETGLRPGEVRMLERIEEKKRRREMERKKWQKQANKAAQRRHAEAAKKHKQCERYTRLYNKVREELRTGYTAERGNYLHAKDRDYSNKMRRYCH